MYFSKLVGSRFAHIEQITWSNIYFMMTGGNQYVKQCGGD